MGRHLKCSPSSTVLFSLPTKKMQPEIFICKNINYRRYLCLRISLPQSGANIRKDLLDTLKRRCSTMNGENSVMLEILYVYQIVSSGTTPISVKIINE